jgi:hypothetical protein
MSIISIFTHTNDLVKEKKISENLQRVILQDCLEASKTGLFTRYEPQYRQEYIDTLANLNKRATKAKLTWKYPGYDFGLPIEYKRAPWCMLLHNFGYLIRGEPCVTFYHREHLVDIGWMTEPLEDVKAYTNKPPIYYLTKGKIPYL